MHPRPDVISPAGADTLIKRSLNAMGCRFEFLLDPRDSAHDRYSVEAIVDVLVDLVHDWHNRLTVFAPSSIVSNFNRQPTGQLMRVDQDLFDLLTLCETMRTQTQGAFNIAAGTLMHAHGFRDTPPTGTSDSLDLDRAITLDPFKNTIARNDDRVTIDFGAIAKGFVLDLVRRELIDYGIEHAFIHGGTSSAIALGTELDSNENQQPWRVRVAQEPKLDACISGQALSVSEIGSRIIDQPDGQAIGHIMDTRTNQPAASAIGRVACVHQSAAVADAYSTALHARPDLIDDLEAFGCSFAIFNSTSTKAALITRDRLNVFLNT